MVWWSETKSQFIREKDLRNHLTATIETAEEKKQRREQEKKARILRAQKIRDRQNKKQEDDEIFTKYNPDNDFQVMQAINYLETYKFFKSF